MAGKAGKKEDLLNDHLLERKYKTTRWSKRRGGIK
jgi:hypothetical protein